MSRGTWHNLARLGRLACILLMSALFLVGCGKSEKSASKNDDAQEETTNKGHASTGSDDKDHSPKPGSTEKGERRFVGDVPLDVWIDDPLTVARNNTPVGGIPIASVNPTPVPTVKVEEKGAGAGDNPKPVSTAPDKGTPAPPVTVASGDWKSLVSGEMIADEAKAIRANISNSLQKLSSYNNDYKVIQEHAAVLAALAVVAANHPDSLSWKKNAHFVRDLAADVGKQAKGPAKVNFDNTKLAFDRLDNLLSGNRPADLKPADEKAQFSQVAPRGALMRRMDRTVNGLKATVSSEGTLKSSSEKAAHESAILAVLSKVVASTGYESADEPDYQKFLDSLIKSSLGAAAAARESDFQAFSSAMSKSQKTCNECHSTYRFSSG